MLVVTVDFELKPDARGLFLPLITRNARQSIENEPGCRRFDVCVDPDRPENVFLYELYDDRAAFDVHQRSAHFSAFNEESKSLVVDKTIRLFQKIE